MNPLVTLLRLPHFRAQARLSRDMRSSLRLQFLYAGIECELFDVLRNPMTQQAIVENLQVRRPELLETLLRLGVALKELSTDGERYRLRGRASRALASKDGDPIAALIQENVYYHGSVYRHLTSRLRGAPLGDYLPSAAPIIARSSRVIEPFVTSFVRMAVPSRGSPRILEVGCGSGIYLRQAARVNGGVNGVGIDMQPEVVDQARKNLADWGVAGLFQLLVADIRQAPPVLDGPFDLITLYNNIYYFDPAEYRSLFRDLRRRLAPGGALALVSFMQGGSLLALDFDLVLRSTIGCARLPAVDELVIHLREAGFGEITATRLMPAESLHGVIARAPS